MQTQQQPLLTSAYVVRCLVRSMSSSSSTCWPVLGLVRPSSPPCRVPHHRYGFRLFKFIYMVVIRLKMWCPPKVWHNYAVSKQWWWYSVIRVLTFMAMLSASGLLNIFIAGETYTEDTCYLSWQISRKYFLFNFIMLLKYIFHYHCSSIAIPLTNEL